jgi:aminomethyltransferase
MMELKTPLYQRHLALGGKMVPFAGYLLPLQYEAGVIAEHLAVRQKCGLFDVSHMGEFILRGPGALANINRLLSNDYTNLELGRVRYGLLCNERGGVIDDLLIYKLGDEHYLAVVNAANREKDAAWIRGHLTGAVVFSDISGDMALIALQGPESPAILAKLTAAIPGGYYHFINKAKVGEVTALISQTGYTGEKGYEIMVENAAAPAIWDSLLQAGEEAGLLPCGLGARDTLRLEAAMPLWGHEMDESVTPLEAGLDFAVRLDKDFLGRDAIAAANPPARLRYGLAVTGRGIIREHQDVYRGGQLLGRTTSGTFCPFLSGGYAMALLTAGSVKLGDRVEADVRGRRVEAEIVALPFYKRA